MNNTTGETETRSAQAEDGQALRPVYSSLWRRLLYQNLLAIPRPPTRANNQGDYCSTERRME
ncbi:hypothetical protein Desti_3895 [Desulfomonile tiedjei DSM 6799]|uniref:Uncharacterized protein n=1 Tax=Desulfomonile tiedjei (strain ATCC 49306 / DSM 6799 / DCB-1) TaxID=706587 RepID=I4CAE6_DESTA|nr:hypothetical protein Desti_3895 [Desulfomonile tiedjei DSM 6799]